MYTGFFGINEKPFSITPDPRYLFMSERHGEALAHLVYGVTESGGFIQLTGEVGTGKTTLCRTLLLNRMPSNADVAVVLNPQLSALEFLQAICEELGVDMPEERNSIKALLNALNRYLLDAHADGRRTILVVDEAQNLAPEVLEEVRLLTNLETAKQKLLQIILIGQPELRELLARNDLRQLAQRITGRYHLEPLSEAETRQYIEHRLKVSGAVGEVFESAAKREVYRLSKGVPRLINVICDRALLGAYSLGVRKVNRKLVRRAAAEVTGNSGNIGWRRWLTPALSVAALAIVAVGLFFIDGAAPWQLQSLAAHDAGDARADLAETRVPAAAPPVVEMTTESTAPPQPEVSLDEQLTLASELTSAEAALATLFDLWGIDATDSGQPACARAESLGYRCMAQRGSWSGLRRLDRPAVLTLTDRQGTTHHVVLTAIEGERAHLSIGGVAVDHRIDAVSDLWFGQFQLLWRPPSGIPASLGPGARGPDVLWLRQSLAAIDAAYQATPVGSDVYNSALEIKVREFQRDHRLDVDGLAGQQTQIIINSLLAPDDTPRLTTPRLAQE